MRAYIFRRALTERSWCRIAQRNCSGKQQTVSWGDQLLRRQLFLVEAGGASGRGALPLRNQPIGSQLRHTQALSLTDLLQDGGSRVSEGPRNDKHNQWTGAAAVCGSLTVACFRCRAHLMVWRGQVDCTGVGTAELGLISMAL